MDDTVNCPICSNKMRTIRLVNKYLHVTDKIANYMERTCSGAPNHNLQFFTEENKTKVDFLKLSLNHKYSRYIEIDFIHEKCRISCLKNSKPEYIQLDKIIEPDFPNLVKLREKVSMYIIFS